MLQRRVGIKIVVANRLPKHHLKAEITVNFNNSSESSFLCLVISVFTPCGFLIIKIADLLIIHPVYEVKVI